MPALIVWRLSIFRYTSKALIRRALFVLVLGVTTACGGTAASSDYVDPRDPANYTGGASSGGSGSGGEPVTGGNAPVSSGGAFVETPCEDVPPEQGVMECDPMDPINTCSLEGTGCYPYARFPKDGECGATVYGAYCVYSGQGSQGDICSVNNDYCQPGFLCVVGATGGPRCAKLCNVFAPETCPDGLVCGETDVLDYGVCY